MVLSRGTIHQVLTKVDQLIFRTDEKLNYCRAQLDITTNVLRIELLSKIEHQISKGRRV